MENKWKFFFFSQGIYIEPSTGRLTFPVFLHWKFVSSVEVLRERDAIRWPKLLSLSGDVLRGWCVDTFRCR